MHLIKVKQMSLTQTRPFLKWAGCKYSSLIHILKTLPNAPRFIEPFAGSGAVFINTDYPNYLINEKNNDLIYLFQHLQSEGDRFIEFCEPYFSNKNNNAEQYYRLREEFNQITNTRQRAALFVYLNRHGYNGLCRYNQSGVFNVPFGRYTNPTLPKTRMQFFYKKSQNAIFTQGDFSDAFKQANPGDVIYCDPPYAPLDQDTNFSSYTSTVFGENEQISLATLAQKSVMRGITVIISNHDTEFTRDLYQGSKIKSFPVARYISRNLNRRTPVQELLAIFKP